MKQAEFDAATAEALAALNAADKRIFAGFDVDQK